MVEEKQDVSVASKEEVETVKEEIKEEEKTTNSLIDEAKKVNDAREAIIDREEKLQARKERLHAEELVAGKGQVTPESTAEKATNERIKAVGDATGAGWAKDMEKKDGN